MKKVYLLITAICLAALTGCIKEDVELTEANVSMSITTRLDLSSLSSKEQGDAIADINVWSFACDANGNVKNVKDPAIAWRRITTANTHTSVDVHLQFTTCKDDQPRYYKLVAVINKDAFGKIDGITTSDGVTTFDRNTTYDQLADATFEAPEGLMTMNPGHGPNSTPGQMPISHWTIIKLEANNDSDKDENIDTHPGECYKVSMPVYRALAKTQLLVAKSDENSTVTIKNVEIGAGSMGTDGTVTYTNAYPTEGALLSAAAGSVNADGTAGDLNPGNTPQWYVSSVAKSSTAVEKDILTAESITIGKTVAETNHATAAYEDFTPITSYFLYENTGGNGGAWNKASTNGGYYMDVTYNAGAGDKTERVWLPAVVRNHDIQVRALVNAGGKMVLTLKVKQWTPVSEVHNYLNEVSIPQGGQIQWEDGVEPDENGNITLGAAANNSVSCKFFLNTPANGTWQAELVTVEGQEGAFTFVDVEGNPIGSTTSGPIAGSATPASLTIKTTRDNSIQGGAVSENKVELRITATATVGGVQRTYKVTGLTGITGVDYYTIVQTR